MNGYEFKTKKKRAAAGAFFACAGVYSGANAEPTAGRPSSGSTLTMASERLSPPPMARSRAFSSRNLLASRGGSASTPRASARTRSGPRPPPRTCAAGSQPALWGDAGVPLVSGVESYLLKLGTAPTVSFENIMLGIFAGPMGTTHFLVIAVCGICLLCRRSMSLLVTAFGLGSYCALTAMFPAFSSIGDTLLLELSGGYLLFGFVFLASDPQTLPKTPAGKIVYGIVIGIIGCLFRHFGKVEGSFIFVLLIANAFSLRLDDLCAFIARNIRRVFVYLHGNMGRYERLRSDAENERRPKLTDTMEIIVPATNYNMPPIDNKVTKINRKKPNIITRFADNRRIKKKKEELVRRKQIHDEEGNYMNAMRSMIEQRHETSAPKTEAQKTGVPHIIKQPRKRSQQKNNKQGQ